MIFLITYAMCFCFRFCNIIKSSIDIFIRTFSGNLNKSLPTYFLIDPDGKIKLAEVNDNGIGRNADELLRKTQAAQFIAKNPNEVCPAKWQPGGETLKPGLNLIGKI